ncbi:GNAT family N-acetyltransferase [Bifidobacterium jacchi]|uniref:GNAT family N-acetyltransferase n=1 Tax=Bifidobacterium jacchi TaxID=2490545 RepID=A0A5N5RLC3_9BIFI|nr:GNAT family N-acetyltransferase [Bifidobacterium jacchi]KAB5607571.1 GNAT family N-acetyltransferase [Bifidobacterium jacchi]
MSGELWTRIVKLDDMVDISTFSCGEPEIDVWLHRDALERQEEGGCTVYVAVDGMQTVIGFFSLSMHYLQNRTIPEPVKTGVALPGNIPCVLLGRFGIDSHFHGKHQGTLLIREAIMTAKSIADTVGCRLMYVQAMNDRLIAWYEGQGFASMPKHPRNMVLDLKSFSADD